VKAWGEPTATQAESVPDEEHIDPSRIEEDLEQFED
jgi:hypothetical protein